MTADLLHPAWPLAASAVVLALTPATGRRLLAVGAPAASAALAWSVPDGTRAVLNLMGQDLLWLRVDALGRVFALAFAILAGLGSVYALAEPRRRLLGSAHAAAAGAIAVALAGDWVSLYAAWEALAVASFVLVLDGSGPRAAAAAFRYLLVHLAGGAALLAGITAHVAAGGSRAVEPMPAGGPAALVLLAFALNAAVPPLHAWLTDAYPESSPAGSVFLSAFATKAAVCALARVFPGLEALVPVGVAMALYGVVFAVLENDIRRLLAYHIVSQVGYMVTAVGVGTPLALAGATAHAFCHILYKGLLLMGAGAVVHATGRRRLTELGGLAGAMPVTLALYLVGALAISGAPLLNGFVSKSVVVVAAEADHRPLVAGLLHLASVGTFLHTGLKLPWFTFAGPPRSPVPAPVPRPMTVAMALASALCLLTGVWPGLLYGLLPVPVDWHPYTAAHVLESLELLAGTALGFVLLRRRLAGEPTVTLDTDRLYRALGRAVAERLAPAVARCAAGLEAAAARLTEPATGPARLVGSPVGYAVLAALAAIGVGLGLLLLPAR
ncbi:MAG TPA: Na(+)/H(+) antiporter subunit D [Calidithermus sp.]|nr:Na(+)/H(+) antiporter subunit D [Calidithermus sp.]